MGELAKEVLIVAASARGLAESAARAGYRVYAIDAYGDVDLRAQARTIAMRRDLGREWSAAAAATAAAAIPCRSVAYGSNLENHPAAVARLASGRRLWGNDPEILRRARDPIRLAEALRSRGLPAPRTSVEAERSDSPGWLLKPRLSGGGHGIRPLRAGERIPRTRYVQERIDGTPGSITFVADGHRVVPLGLSRQLVGLPGFGSTGFRYCGSLLCGGAAPLFDRQPVVLRSAVAAASAVTETFGLVGVNGLDFIARDGEAWVVELNPRYSASMELVERAHGISIFQAHVDGCSGRLPSAAHLHRPLGRVHGKAVVYAMESSVARRVRRWRDEPIRDVPRPGERIERGRPICTVFAAAESAAGCMAVLEARAAWVYSAGTRADRSAA